MRSPVLPPIRMNAADTSASRAMALCTPLTVVPRSLTTAEIDTFISDVSTTSTNIAIASSSARRPLNGTVFVASGSMAHPGPAMPPGRPCGADEGGTPSAELVREALDRAVHRGDLDVRDAAGRAGGEHRLVRGAQGRPHLIVLALEGGAQRADLVAEPGRLVDRDRRLDVRVRVVLGTGRRGRHLDLGNH